jgi:hypothetical protein
MSKLDADLANAKDELAAIRDRTHLEQAQQWRMLGTINARLDHMAHGIDECQKRIVSGESLAASLDQAAQNSVERTEALCECTDLLQKSNRRLANIRLMLSSIGEVDEWVEWQKQKEDSDDGGKTAELKFRMEMLMNSHKALQRQFDNFARIMMGSEDFASINAAGSYPPDIMPSSVKHWISHLIDAAKQVMPGAYTPKIVDNLQQQVTDCNTTSAAVATILWAIKDLAIVASTTAALATDDKLAGPRAALQLYSAVYPVARHAIVALSLMPGPWTRNSPVQIAATTNLKEYLDKMVAEAKVEEVYAIDGEPYTGFGDTARDRWLPLVVYGHSRPEFPHLLLSSPPRVAEVWSGTARTESQPGPRPLVRSF